jgi:hypothetical protein
LIRQARSALSLGEKHSTGRQRVPIDDRRVAARWLSSRARTVYPSRNGTSSQRTHRTVGNSADPAGDCPRLCSIHRKVSAEMSDVDANYVPSVSVASARSLRIVFCTRSDGRSNMVFGVGLPSVSALSSASWAHLCNAMVVACRSVARRGHDHAAVIYR